MKKRGIFLALVLVFVSMIGCGASSEKSQNRPTEPSKTEGYSVTIDNFNKSTTFEKAPDSVIVLSYNSAEILSALGVADKIIALQEGHNTVMDVLEEYRAALEDVPKPEEIDIKGGVPTLENMLALHPDLIVTNSYYFNVPTFGKVEDYEQNHTKLYITEGSYVENATVDNTYNDIVHLGRIFDVEDKAVALVDEMKAKIEGTNKKVRDLEPVRAMIFDSERNNTPFVAGGSGSPQNILQLAGGENIFADIEMQYSGTTWEEIIDRDPDAIVIIKYAEADDAEKKIDKMKAMPELANVSAVKNDRFIIVPLNAVFPGIQNVNAVEIIAEGLHPEVFR